MKRRLVRTVLAVLLAVLVLDTVVWLVAVSALRRAAENWTARQREAGVDITLGPTASGGWPFAAALEVPSLAVGPAGLPAGARVAVAATLALAPSHARVARATIRMVDVTAPGVALSGTAESWTVDVPILTQDRSQDRATTTARALRVVWGDRSVTLGGLQGAAEISGSAETHISVVAQQVDLSAAGLTIPPALGPIVATAGLDATILGLPVRDPGATTLASWAESWRGGGGTVRVSSCSLVYGPLDATARGAFGLDEALRPAGDGTITARGLPALLDALGSSGAVAPRAGLAARGVLALLGGADGAVALPVTAADGVLSVARFPLGRLAVIR